MPRPSPLHFHTYPLAATVMPRLLLWLVLLLLLLLLLLQLQQHSPI
jgi:quinol-cytochrome oxidoreductase complex cytochrome b subunit